MIGIRLPHAPPRRKKILLTPVEWPCHGLLGFHIAPAKPSVNDEGSVCAMTAGSTPPTMPIGNVHWPTSGGVAEPPGSETTPRAPARMVVNQPPLVSESNVDEAHVVKPAGSCV